MAILADLVRKFGVGPENVATEALNLILNGSHGIRKSFIRFCEQSGVNLPDDLTFRTQLRTEGYGQPDLVGRNSKGNLLIIEAKFDAGLTDNQPVAYFEHFSNDGLLVFIVPHYRRHAVWSELCRRCRDQGLELRTTPSTSWSSLVQVGKHHLGLVSWQAVLGFMRDSARDLGDEDTLHDLDQLWVLCQRMDEDAFVPFRSEQLTDVGLARVFAQLTSLPSRVISAAVIHGICVAGRPAHSEDFIGKYMRIGRYLLYVGIFFKLWKKYPVSPLWLQSGVGWPENIELPSADKDQLRFTLSSFSSDPLRSMVEMEGNLHLPLILKPGAEHDEVIDGIMQQLTTLRNALLGI